MTSIQVWKTQAAKSVRKDIANDIKQSFQGQCQKPNGEDE